MRKETQMNPPHTRGFSLIEALACLLLLSVLLSIATTSLGTVIQQQRYQTATSDMLNALNYARSKAITYKNKVSLCAGQARCDNSQHWQQQLLIFSDLNGNGQIDTDDTLLKISELDPSISWSWSNFRNMPHLTFRPNGATHSLNGTFTLCQASRAIKINPAGRSRPVTTNPDEPCPQ